MRAGAARPQQMVPLFSGGTFDAGFNRDEARAPIRFATPNGTRRALLEAVITGNAVAMMFCSSSHHGACPVYASCYLRCSMHHLVCACRMQPQPASSRQI